MLYQAQVPPQANVGLYPAQYRADESSSAKEKYRVGVARVGKNAILYMNDVEKDPV